MSRRIFPIKYWLQQKVGHEDKILSEIEPKNPLKKQIIIEVSRALHRLSGPAREIVERYYYMGQSYQEISRDLYMTIGIVERKHKYALLKLAKYLAPFVEKSFGISSIPETNCIICNSPFRAEIERLIDSKPASQTWKAVLRKLKNHYQLDVKGPQIIMSHLKYHLEEDNND